MPRGDALESEDTLTLHQNGCPELGVSFKTTKLIESVMARVEAKTVRVDRRRTSDQKLRSCAAVFSPPKRSFVA